MTPSSLRYCGEKENSEECIMNILNLLVCFYNLGEKFKILSSCYFFIFHFSGYTMNNIARYNAFFFVFEKIMFNFFNKVYNIS